VGRARRRSGSICAGPSFGFLGPLLEGPLAATAQACRLLGAAGDHLGPVQASSKHQITIRSPRAACWSDVRPGRAPPRAVATRCNRLAAGLKPWPRNSQQGQAGHPTRNKASTRPGKIRAVSGRKAFPQAVRTTAGSYPVWAGRALSAFAVVGMHRLVRPAKPQGSPLAHRFADLPAAVAHRSCRCSLPGIAAVPGPDPHRIQPCRAESRRRRL